MTIDRLLARSRKRAVWLNTDVPEVAQAAFEQRHFQVSPCSEEELEQHAFLAGVGVVVFTQNPHKAFQITRDLDRHLERLLDFDCRVIVQPVAPEKVEPGTRDQPPPDHRSIVTLYLSRRQIPVAGNLLTDSVTNQRIRQQGRSDPPAPHVRIMNGDETWDNIANYVMEHPPGDAPATAEQLSIIGTNTRSGRSTPLRPSKELLLRRAFADCAEVHLVRMRDGHSRSEVYRAYPKVRIGLLKGKWLLPYFVKVGNRNQIFGEYENYMDAVNGYIPFHLGPHLVPERCCLGARCGVIVGDWVEESESLRDCARNGRAATAIACLFDRTLHGWYRSAEMVEGKSLPQRLTNRFPKDIPAQRLVLTQQLGAQRSLRELKEAFFRCESQRVLVGPIHGDLHAANVRVRATDAIVIDFYSHRGAPLLFDFACLEASLLVEGFANDPGTPVTRWFTSVEGLYAGTVDLAPGHADPHDENSWFHACVRQIRHHAQRIQIDEGQYALCLALALLVKASKDPAVPVPEDFRRASAYVFAERILEGSFGAQHAIAPHAEALVQ
ncbi:MAG TPA: phosphotransferase [Xanthobacteraceae bacterium]|nr:phosphotransferase [Xanthobacteraceae bacterium]